MKPRYHGPMMFDIDAATKELHDTTIEAIERATALTWGGRAAAAYRLAVDNTGAERQRWVMDAENYRQESLEHAAMAEDLDFLRQVQAAIQTERAKLARK